MLSNFCLKIFNNKNLLMLFSVCIYVLALVSVLTSTLFLFSFCLLIFSILFIVKKYFPIKYIIIWNLLFYVGVLNLSFRLKDVDELSNLAPLNSEITGVIVSIPQGIAESNPKFFFNIENLKSGSLEKKFKNEKILINGDFNFNEDDLKIYNSLKIKGRLAAPFKAGNPFQFDYGDYLRNHNTYAVFYARDIELVKKELSLKSKILQEISNYRENVIKRHSKYLDSPYLEILGGIVFGDDAISPSKDIKHSFINSGLLHILAASGMNVAFIYGFFFLILSRLRLNFRFNILFSMLMVVIYTFMTGLGASIIRAASMLLFILIGKLIDRDAHSISLLFFVGLLMLLYNPLFINDVGFQLSFVVTFGILLMSQYIIKFKNKVFDFIASIVIIPIIAQLWVIPIQIFYFNNICIYSIFANIMSVPLLMLISFGGFVSALLIGIIPLCADLICKIFDFILAPLLKCLVMISDFWGDLPNSVIQTIHPSIFQILLYYTFLFFITLFFNKVYRDKFLKKILGIVIGIFILFLITLIPVKNSNLEIITFDVGNADCFLIKTPNNRYIMIDSGKAAYKSGKSQAEVVILKYLKGVGIKKIDSIVITHFDNDHCGGVVDLMNNISIEKIYVNDLNHNSSAAKLIYETAYNRNIGINLAYNNQIIYNEDNLKLTNLLNENINDKNDNENSIVTLLEYNDFSMLFTGDANIKELKSIIKYLPHDITVLKVPHHGANGGLNKKIISKLNPKYSIISVGDNMFGHPTNYLLKLLNNSVILRTDIDNSILLKIKQDDFKILTYDLKKKKYVLYKK